jgi:hypothetical protein
MSKFKFSALISAICLMSVVFSGWVGFSQSPQPAVRLTTEPSVSQILPFEAEARLQSPVQLTLQTVDGLGKPLENANIHLTILTPPKIPGLRQIFPSWRNEATGDGSASF